jgi:hypothetical protein
MVDLGIANSRMKDYFDLWYLVTHFRFDGAVLSEAFRKTFERRRTPLPVEIPVGIADEFGNDRNKQAQWKAFLKKGKLADAPHELMQVVGLIRSLVWPILCSLHAKERFEVFWSPVHGWQ